ncbi:TPA: hypothetical protein DF272_05170 [Candidatus Falkowbacteria bacterium]|nr:hypothetical protein [Candidatus Falkowbacteria bacterium]
MIRPKIKVLDRTKLSPELAVELMRLTMLIGEAMTLGLNNRGIDIGRINYQDNGNWSVFKPDGPYLHIHLYGRAKSAKFHPWGDACHFPHRETGFYDSFEPLNDADIAEIQKQIALLSLKKQYQLTAWNLS